MATHLSTLTVACGDMEAVLDTSRFGPGGRSRCILYEGQWITLTHFEEISGKGSSHNWKRSVKYQNKPLIYWIEEGKLNICNKACCCYLCQGGTPSLAGEEESPIGTKVEPEQRAPKLAAIAKARQQEYDSDSGISMSSCTKALQIDTNFEDEIIMEEEDQAKPEIKTELDYTSMAQEALLALSQSAGGSGSSQMNLLLYILNNYSPSEDISIVNNKVKTSLKFLTRMGIIDKLSVDGNGTDSDDEASQISSAMSDPKPTEIAKQNNATPTTKAKKKTLKQQNEAKSTKGPKTELNQKVKKKKINHKMDQENKKPSVFSKPKKLSPALALICGDNQLCRQEVVKRMWRYVKSHKLQDTNQRTIIVCDENLRAVTKKKRVPQTELLGVLKFHLTDANI